VATYCFHLHCYVIGFKETKRNTVRPGPRVKTKIAEPWIPAPGKTSQRDKLDKNYKWNVSDVLYQYCTTFCFDTYCNTVRGCP